MRWDREVDVAIIGAGAAGMTAAIVAKSEGLEPLVLEKTDQIGGTAAVSGGMMWFVDSEPMRGAGVKDSIEKTGREFFSTGGHNVARPLPEAYIKQRRVAPH